MKNEFAIAEVMSGQLNALVKNLMAQMAIDDASEAVRRVNAGEWVVRMATGLLRQITTVPVGGVMRFCAKDHLKSANVGWMGDNFKRLFLNKVEENVGDVVLAVHCLERESNNALIQTELGARAEIQLAHSFKLLENQCEHLLVNGNANANIAYIKGSDGNFWAVSARWLLGDRFWGLHANSVEDPSKWSAGSHVLSRDS